MLFEALENCAVLCRPTIWTGRARETTLGASRAGKLLVALCLRLGTFMARYRRASRQLELHATATGHGSFTLVFGMDVKVP